MNKDIARKVLMAIDGENSVEAVPALGFVLVTVIVAFIGEIVPDGKQKEEALKGLKASHADMMTMLENMFSQNDKETMQ